MKTKQIVAIGNPYNGFTYYGPFNNHNQALTWAEKELAGDWWVIELENPKEA